MTKSLNLHSSVISPVAWQLIFRGERQTSYHPSRCFARFFAASVASPVVPRSAGTSSAAPDAIAPHRTARRRHGACYALLETLRWRRPLITPFLLSAESRGSQAAATQSRRSPHDRARCERRPAADARTRRRSARRRVRAAIGGSGSKATTDR